MTLNDIEHALDDAKRLQCLCDAQATAMARMLVNRLHKVNDRKALADLKRELKGFHLQHWTWMEGK